MQDTSIVRLTDFTKDSAAKAVIAAGGVFTSTVNDVVCHANRSMELACAVAQNVSDLLKILLGMMLLDLFTGVLASRSEGQRIESKRLSVGMKRKVIMLCIVASSVMADAVLASHGLSTGHALYKWTASWFIAVEALSLYENGVRMGIPMPTFLKAVFERLLQRAEKSGDAVTPQNDPTPSEEK